MFGQLIDHFKIIFDPSLEIALCELCKVRVQKIHTKGPEVLPKLPPLSYNLKK